MRALRGAGRTCLAALVFVALLIVTSGAVRAEAAPGENGSAAEEYQHVGLQPVDWVIIGLYLLTTIGMGVYFSRRQESTSEYFVGGGNMNPVLVGVSLFATLLSTISYLSMPGEALGKGPVAIIGVLSFPCIYFVTAYWLIPVYMRQRVTSAYELLEHRLGLSVRLLGASMFLLLRMVWMTLLVYLAAKAMTVMMGVDASWITTIAAVTGIVSVIYTSLGGLRAVIVTDLMQSILLFGGALLVVGTVTYDFGGFGWFPTEWQPTWDSQPVFSLDPKTRVTMVGTLVSIFAWYVATLGGDQTSVQRFMATADVKAARRAVATQLTVGVVVQMTLFLVGFALLGYFLAHPERLPAGMQVRTNADDLFPRYISYHLPVGVSGFVVSAMFAAAMSSIDSGVNSITAVVMTDFFERFGWKPKTQRGHVRAAQLLALVIGILVVMGGTLMRYIPGNITAVTNKTVNLLTTPIFALFFFALFVPRATPRGVWLGAICGSLTAATIAFSGPLVYFLHQQFGIDPATLHSALVTQTDVATGQPWVTAEDPISFQWIGPAAFLVNVAVGLMFLRPKSKADVKA